MTESAPIPDTLPSGVQQYVRDFEREGRAAIAASGWWTELLQDGTVELDPPRSAAVLERESRHYVLGAMSPFIFARGHIVKGERRGVAKEVSPSASFHHAAPAVTPHSPWEPGG